MDPDVRKLLTLCNSPCIPKGATPEQAQHIKDLINKFGLPDNDPGLKEYLYLHRDDLTKALNDIDSASDITELQARMRHLTDANMPVTLNGAPDYPHEGPQATRLARLEGGGEFEFLGNSSQGVEGYFTPTGSTTRIPVSLKDFSGTGKMRNLIAKINQNANNILPADAGQTVLHAAVPQFKADDMIDFIKNGPVKNMPNEGKFQKLIFDCEDGVVVVDASGVRLR
jgi:hypothetical protein